MRYMVFGATGYLGRHVAAHLVRAGHAVSGSTRSADSGEALRDAGIDGVVTDLGPDTDFATLLADCDGAVFCAQLMLEDEARVAAAVLDALAGTGKPFILTSGTSLMSIATGGLWDERSFAEDEPFAPRRQIAPRLEIETMVREAASRDVRGIVIRPPVIWGNGGCRMISDFYHSARLTGAVCHVGPGLNVYSNVHVDDLAELYRLALEKGRPGALYFAVSGEVSYGVMARTIANHLGVGTRAVTVEEACEIWDPFMAKIVLQSCSRQRSPRAREELGWRPSEARLDILDECVAPSYALEVGRSIPSWVRRVDRPAAA